MNKIKLSELEIYKVIRHYRPDKIRYIVQANGAKFGEFLEINYFKKYAVGNHLLSSGHMRDRLYAEMMIPTGIKEIRSVQYKNAPQKVKQLIKGLITN